MQSTDAKKLRVVQQQVLGLDFTAGLSDLGAHHRCLQDVCVLNLFAIWEKLCGRLGEV